VLRAGGAGGVQRLQEPCHVSGAARVLGLQRTTLIEKMRKFAIDREEA
jgi:transcriptional regulator of acetoin/glycerol metabolism